MARFLLRRRASISLLAVITVLLATGATADAAVKKAMWGPVQVGGQSQFPIYDDLGVDVFEFKVSWETTAPTRPANPVDPADPAYRWPAELDLAVAEGARYGIGIHVLVMRTPGWANGDKGHTVPPTDPDAFAQFMEALAKRYPTIRLFQVWGEPNLLSNFQVRPGPTLDYYARRGNATKLKPFTAKQRSQARRYAEMVDTTYGRLKALNRANKIIGGNATTSGSVDPFNWARFVRLANGKPPRMDFWGHNPFGTRGPDLKKPQLVPGTADFSDLDVFQPWVRKYQSRAGRNRNLKLYATEYTAPTDAPSFEFPYHVTRDLQAKWLKAAWRVAEQQRLYALGWIWLYDHRRAADGAESRIGLIDFDGNRKPSYAVYKNLH